MKHYLNKFANPTGYTTAKANRQTFYRPAVSLIDSTNDVMYDPKFYFNPRYLYSDLTTSKNLNSSKTVIGVEVIPANHMSDRKARFVSVKNMSKSNPEAGSIEIGNERTNSAAYFPWGNFEDVPSLTHYDMIGERLSRNDSAISENNFCGFIEELHDGPTSSLVTDFDNGVQHNEYPFFENTYFMMNLVSGTSQDILPYPFNEDGSKNTLYCNNTNVFSDIPGAITDMNGKSNTATLISLINIDGWQTGALNTTVSSSASEIKNFPAAAACYRFSPANSNTTHQWYLPAAGELGYLMANIAKINAKIDSLSNDQGIKIGMINSQSELCSDLGSKLLSSTGSSSMDNCSVFTLDTGVCSIMIDNKNNEYNASRVRTFIAI